MNFPSFQNRQLLPFLVLLTFVFLITGCAASEEQKNLAQKAMEKIDACKAAGNRPFTLKSKCLVWDLGTSNLHRAHDLLEGSMKYNSGDGPVTIFLVTAKQSQQVGTYSISRQPAYREWVNIYVVESPDFKPIGTYEVVSLDPRQSRPVQQNPEYGDVAPPIAKWIGSLPR